MNDSQYVEVTHDEFHGPSVGQLIAPVEVPEQLTPRQMKDLMRQYFTVRRAVVSPCGHKMDLQTDLNTNCPYCWFAWFNNNGELVQTTDELFQTHGPEAVVAVKGKKFLKQFLRFMVTLHVMKQQMQEKQSEQSARCTESSSDPWESAEYIGGGN